MTQPDDLQARLRTAIETRLKVAREASSARGSATPTGEHWRWECERCDTAIDLNPVTILDEFVECPNCESCGVALRSVEEYETNSVGQLPHFVINSAEEIRPVDALYAILHDPADAIRRYERDLAVLAEHRGDFPHNPDDGPGDYSWTETCMVCHEPTPCRVTKGIAAVYPEVAG